MTKGPSLAATSLAGLAKGEEGYGLVTCSVVLKLLTSALLQYYLDHKKIKWWNMRGHELWPVVSHIIQQTTPRFSFYIIWKRLWSGLCMCAPVCMPGRDEFAI